MNVLGELLFGPAVALANWLAVRAVRAVRGAMVVTIGPATAGRPVEGTVTVTARRNLGPAPLRVTLVGEEDWWEITRANRVDDPHRVKRTDQIYRYEVDLDSTLLVERGSEWSTVFRLPTPDPMTGRLADGQVSNGLVSDGRASVTPLGRTSPRSPAKVSDRPNQQRWTLTVVYDLRGPSFETTIDLPLVYDLDRTAPTAGDQ